MFNRDISENLNAQPPQHKRKKTEHTNSIETQIDEAQILQYGLELQPQLMIKVPEQAIQPQAEPPLSLESLPEKKPEKQIKEPLTKKIEKLLLDFKANQNGYLAVLAKAEEKSMGNKSHSQDVLLRNINSYLDIEHRMRISEEGHCHGMVLLWLTMMSWEVESLFYEMIKVIADCPVEQLAKIGNLIPLFLDCIEVGQNPGEHSDRSNACTQADVDIIIGDVDKSHSETKFFTKREMEDSFLKLSRLDNDLMVACQGWWNEKKTGHSVGLFIHGGKYFTFDPNDRSGKGASPTYAKSLAAHQVWCGVLAAAGIEPNSQSSLKFSLNAVVNKQAANHPLAFFSPSRKAVANKKENAQLVSQPSSTV